MMNQQRPWFLDQPAPPGYVAGLGRGATGFTTRSDIGPARMAEDLAIPERGQQYQKRKKPEDEEEGEEGETEAIKNPNDLSDSGLLSGGDYDNEDREADEIWSKIDEHMDQRRKRRREEREKKEIEKYRQERPKIQTQFADLKVGLKGLSEDEWSAIPEIGDRSIKYKRNTHLPTAFSPLPDSVVEGERQRTGYNAQLDEREQQLGGIASTTPGVTTDLLQMGKARHRMVNMKLQRKEDNVQGQSVVDTKTILTDLKSMSQLGVADISDLKRARLLIDSVIQTNPKHAPGWIAGARIEEVAGKVSDARKMILQATEKCPNSDDVWLEAARLHPPQQAKAILARAVHHIPSSRKIWMRAAELEETPDAKKKVLRRALEYIPNSVLLWKAAIELEEPDDARVLLSRAVECVEGSRALDLWLALAKLETYENARVVLNNARKAIPTSPAIWIAAAKLEESNGSADRCKKIMEFAVSSLKKHQVELTHAEWLAEAIRAEKAASSATAKAIAIMTIDLGVEESDCLRQWKEDAAKSLTEGAPDVARAIYAKALEKFPHKKGLWQKAALLEKEQGHPERMVEILLQAIEACPKAEILWLMAAKQKWLLDDVKGARNVLQEAFKANPNSEEIWLAAVKLERENNEAARARFLLQKARESTDTERVWMKSALLERQLREAKHERVLLAEALLKFSTSPKLWLMMAQLEERESDIEAARQTYAKGIRQCPDSIPLWVGAARAEESASSAKARALLEKGRLRNPGQEVLWLEAVRVEERANNTNMANALMAKALQDCPASGLLWSESIRRETIPARQKTRLVDALKKCQRDAHVMVAAAEVFWRDRKAAKARSWFNRATAADPDLGDVWVRLYRFEMMFGTEETRAAVIKRCVDAEPRYGELWTAVSKAPGSESLSTREVLEEAASRDTANVKVA